MAAATPHPLASYEMDFACVPDLRFEPVASTSEGGQVVDRVAAAIRAHGCELLE